MSTFIGYRGKVTVKGKGKPPRGTKNTGTDALFNIIAKFLCGKYTSENMSSDLPRYIDIHAGATSVLNSPVEIVTKNIVEDKNVVFQGMITYDKFKSDTTELSSVKAVLQNSSQSILAQSVLEQGAVEELNLVKNTPDGQATIKWEMNIDNIPVITEGGNT